MSRVIKRGEAKKKVIYIIYSGREMIEYLGKKTSILSFGIRRKIYSEIFASARLATINIYIIVQIAC